MKQKDPSAHHSDQGFPIAALGASAGGLGALTDFFTHMNPEGGIGFVVIQHMDPDHKTMLAELIQKVTSMPVQVAEHQQDIEPDHIYINPPNKSMSLVKGKLLLSEPVEKRGLRLPIDHFFFSLARDITTHSIGIVLSGMGSDGSQGLRAIKEQGGVVMVQEPATARFDSMPVNAIQEVQPDVVAPAGELAGKLMNLKRHHEEVHLEEAQKKDHSTLDEIIVLLHNRTGSDFSSYKKNTLYRRIERRMGVHQHNDLESYLQLLRKTPAEQDILFKELLIGVTSFFRDEACWEFLKEKAIPQLAANRPEGYTLRAWVPGCSTGEEAYSLAIVLQEVLDGLEKGSRFDIQIFGTDLDDAAIEKARKGYYPESSMGNISAERLEKYFTRVNKKYLVKTNIREMIVFAHQNVLRDPPFIRLDLVSCRNFLIYIEPEYQKKIVELFHYSLNPGGLLLLGSSETLDFHDYSFEPLNLKLKIFRKTGTLQQEQNLFFPRSFSTASTPADGTLVSEKKAYDSLQSLTDELLLKEFAPASVLTTAKGDILYVTGSTGKYMEPPAGKANFNLFAMAREGLRDELPMAFSRANDTFDPISLPGLRIGPENERQQQVTDVIIRQIKTPLALKGKILIVFQNRPQQQQQPPLQIESSSQRADQQDQSKAELQLHHLKEELKRTRAGMQRSHDELSTANEELQSTNEELQSTNEELASSKEEMQSLNEGLQEVNNELEDKIEEVITARNDLYNLLNSIEVAVLFLDKKLNIRQFTPAATDIFKLIESDIGRLFTDQATELIYPEMFDDTRMVLRTLDTIQKEVSTHHNRWFRVRIMPYRTLDDKIDGLVVTFIDITQPRNLENSLKDYQAILRKFINETSGIIMGLSEQGHVIEYNARAEELFGLKREQVIGKNYLELFIPQKDQQAVNKKLQSLLRGTTPNSYRHHVKTARGENLLMEWAAHKLYNKEGNYIGIINIGTNITNS